MQLFDVFTHKLNKSHFQVTNKIPLFVLYFTFSMHKKEKFYGFHSGSWLFIESVDLGVIYLLAYFINPCKHILKICIFFFFPVFCLLDFSTDI